MLKIGLSAGMLYPNPYRFTYPQQVLHFIDGHMSQYISQKGVMPIVIPPLPQGALKDFLQELDGIVLHGGADIAPARYGEQPLEGKWIGDAGRDAYEWPIVEHAMELGVPILGICRGFQLLNVYFGGSLYQDLPSQLPSETIHSSLEEEYNVVHQVDLAQGSGLKWWNKGDVCVMVNSLHHQGIKKLGENLEILARSTQDQLVEAFYWKGARAGKVMGIQWHPEFQLNYTGAATLWDSTHFYNHFLSICQDTKKR